MRCKIVNPGASQAFNQGLVSRVIGDARNGEIV